MDLKSGQLYWPHTAPPPPESPPISGSVQCDVLVVGAGISGAMCALRLAKEGLDVVVIDRRPPAAGSTPASTALIVAELDTTFLQLAGKRGRNVAAAAYRACHDAIDDIARLISTLDDDCELSACPCVYLASRPEDAPELARETQARLEAGVAAAYLDSRELAKRFNLHRPAAILTEHARQLNPVRMTNALLRAAVARGVRLHACEQVDLAGAAASDQPLRIQTTNATIDARWVVLATGYETPEQFSLVARRAALKSTYAIATNRLAEPPWPHRAMIWESARPYLYARTTADGRVLVGGEDEDFTNPEARDALLPSKAKALQRKLHDLAPQIDADIDFAWAGAFAETEDGLPLIGAHPNWPHTLFALGYGGNGFVFSQIAAEIIRDSVIGAPNPLAPLLRVDR